MRLAEFLDDNSDQILTDWQASVRSSWPKTREYPPSYPILLRDHAAHILAAASGELRSSQFASEQVARPFEVGPISHQIRHADPVWELHALARATEGFEIGALVTEFRALRTSVLRLWAQGEANPRPQHHDDLIQFNVSIDQALASAIDHVTGQITEEHKQVVEQERQARVEAEGANQAKDVFLATLSHEMRTLLSATIGWTEILHRTEGLDADVVEGLDVIERNTTAQLLLIEDIIDVARIVSGKLRLDLAACDLFETINGAVSIVRPAALAKNITLNVTLAPSARRGVVDASRLQQIAWNLISNAIKFTPSSGVVTVTLTRDPTGLRLVVSDSGCGIETSLLPHVFTRYRQGPSAKQRRVSGLGLGLSIVKHLAELHGGTVEVESAGIGAGSSFVVSLPDIKPVAEVAPRPTYVKPPQLKRATLLPASLSAPIRLDGIAVMIVDDDADARVVNERLLRLVGSEVMTAASGAEALAGLALAPTHGRTPDVLICDIRMPDFDGYEFMQEVRRRGFDAQQLPAIAVTGLQSVEMARKSALAGFQYHLTKPLDIGRLTAVIASLTCPLHVKHLATSD